jgi:hypothetical protein
VASGSGASQGSVMLTGVFDRTRQARGRAETVTVEGRIILRWLLALTLVYSRISASSLFSLLRLAWICLSRKAGVVFEQRNYFLSQYSTHDSRYVFVCKFGFMKWINCA